MDDGDAGNVSHGVAKRRRLLIVNRLPRNDRDAPGSFHDRIFLAVDADNIRYVIAVVRGLSRRRWRARFMDSGASYDGIGKRNGRHYQKRDRHRRDLYPKTYCALSSFVGEQPLLKR